MIFRAATALTSNPETDVYTTTTQALVNVLLVCMVRCQVVSEFTPCNWGEPEQSPHWCVQLRFIYMSLCRPVRHDTNFLIVLYMLMPVQLRNFGSWPRELADAVQAYVMQ